MYANSLTRYFIKDLSLFAICLTITCYIKSLQTGWYDWWIFAKSTGVKENIHLQFSCIAYEVLEHAKPKDIQIKQIAGE